MRGKDLRRREVMLPFGLTTATTRITARTLINLVGGTRKDQLLKKVGDRWDFVPNREVIDLNDREP